MSEITRCVPTTTFVHSVDEELLCASCHGAMTHPVQLPCGHECGWNCAQRVQQNNDGIPRVSCPVAGCSQFQTPVEPTSMVLLSRLGRLVLKSIIRCPLCTFEGPCQQLDRHDCPRELVACPYRCCTVRVERQFLEAHRRECLERVEPCPHCFRSFRSLDLPLHVERCTLREVHCDGCMAVVRLGDLPQHTLQQCSATMVPCPFQEFGCTAQVTRGTVAAHVAQFLEAHCGYLVEALRVERAAAATRVGALTERVSVLERELRGQLTTDSGESIQEVVRRCAATTVEHDTVLTMFLTGRTVTVDAFGRCGHFSNIADAIEACSAGDTILLRPGTYTSPVHISHKTNLTIRGSSVDSVVLSGKLSMKASSAIQLQHLTVASEDRDAPAVRVYECSDVSLSDVRLRSVNLSCCLVEQSHGVNLERCSLDGSRQCGLLLRSSVVSMTGCSLRDCSDALVTVEGSLSSLVAVDCTAENSPGSGLLLTGGARCHWTSGSIAKCGSSNVEVQPECTLELHDVVLYGSHKCGLFVKGNVTATGCRLFDNRLPNVLVLPEALAVLDGCHATSSLSHGVVVKARGRAVLRQCAVQGNCADNVVVEEGANIVVE